MDAKSVEPDELLIDAVTLPPETVALASRVLRYNWTSKEDSWLGRGTQRNRS